MNQPLFAPWRMQYIRSLDKSDGGGCFLCQAGALGEGDSPEQKRNMLVLWVTRHSVVMLNRFPYTNGHILVSPRTHKADLEELSIEELNDLQAQTLAVVKLLKRAISPQGFNVGINLGRCAGAGVPGHLHQHIVPRWAGDTNFISVVGETRIVPQAISQMYDELVMMV